MMRRARSVMGAIALTVVAIDARAQSGTVVVGAKNFTESSVLAELMAQMLEAHTDLVVERRTNLGGTMICHAALLAGEIDFYAEYTGTAWANVLQERGAVAEPLRTYFDVRRRYRADFDVLWLEPFGLDNTYALAMAEARATELGIVRISDLPAHRGEIRTGFSIEFTNRADGYAGLARAYGLDLEPVTLEHGLAYQAIESGAIDLIDAYSTDGKLLRHRLRVLEDDRGFFPPYNAAPLVRGATLRAHPEIEAVLARLAFRLPDRTAQALNHLVEDGGASVALAARAFLAREGLVDDDTEAISAARAELDALLAAPPGGAEPDAKRARPARFLVDDPGKLLRLLLEHVGLTLAAVLLATLFAVPLGIAITGAPRLRQFALGAAGVLQTIPSLALLAFMIPLLGLDAKAAIAALFLYALLPILRNTYTGLTEVDPELVDAARGMGLRPREVLVRVQLPLALRTIMAGIRTATVISIGVATLAAFIGAGGLGEPIVEGLYLNDTRRILTGAVPAALLAIAADLGLGRLEQALQPRMRSVD